MLQECVIMNADSCYKGRCVRVVNHSVVLFKRVIVVLMRERNCVVCLNGLCCRDVS